MKRILVLSFAAAALATTALAQEVITTRSTDNPAPPPAAPVAGLDQPTDNQEQAADWARRVLARANGQLPPTDERAEAAAEVGLAPGQVVGKNGCVRNPDRSPHGEVSAAVGSRGYRGVSGVVTQPVGDCGSVTLGISMDKGGGYGRRWR